MAYARLAVFGLALLLLGLAPAAGAQSAETWVLSFRGTSATTFFNSTEGCIRQEVWVGAVEHGYLARANAAPKPASAVVGISRRDICTGTMLFFGSASAAGGTFVVAPRLTAAELHTTIPVTNLVSGATVPVQVDLVWTGTGALERGQSHYAYEEDGVSVRVHDSGALRFATAAGSVSDGVTAFVPPDASGRGWIAWSNYGQVTITSPMP